MDLNELKQLVQVADDKGGMFLPHPVTVLRMIERIEVLEKALEYAIGQADAYCAKVWGHPIINDPEMDEVRDLLKEKERI